MLEERIIRDEDRIQILEKELEVTILFGEEADRKYEEVGLRALRYIAYTIYSLAMRNAFKTLFIQIRRYAISL